MGGLVDDAADDELVFFDPDEPPQAVINRVSVRIIVRILFSYCFLSVF
jgi:hypothetical protein